MKLYCVYTPAHAVLLSDWFAPSLAEGFELVAERFEIEGRGDFLSEEFLRCIRMKIGRIIESIRENRDGLIVWSDVDILMFGDTAGVLEDLAASASGTDLWFQRERRTGNEVNTGFILIRCTPAAEAFFREAGERMEREPEKNEQRVENEMLREGVAVEWDLLPVEFVARTHGWPPRSDMIIYHANYTLGRDGIGQKIRQFRDVLAIRRWGLPAWCWMVVKRAIDKLLFERRRISGDNA